MKRQTFQIGFDSRVLDCFNLLQIIGNFLSNATSTPTVWLITRYGKIFKNLKYSV